MSNGYPINENLHSHLPAHSRILKITLFIADHLAGDLSARTAAQTFKISLSTLERLFNRHLKQTYRQYVEEVRIHKAFDLITGHDQMIKEAMYGTGYKSKAAFNKAFKRKYGFPPAHFKPG